MKQVMGEDDLTQTSSVHLPEVPSLEPTRETLELSLPKVFGQDLLDKLLLISNAERSSRR
jgi:hypothetical protein